MPWKRQPTSTCKTCRTQTMQPGGEPQRAGTGMTTRPGRAQPPAPARILKKGKGRGRGYPFEKGTSSSSKRGPSSLEKDTEPEQAPAEEGWWRDPANADKEGTHMGLVLGPPVMPGAEGA